MLFDAQPELVAKHVGNDLILYDSANRALHVLNVTAAKVFQLCDGSHTLQEMAEALVDCFHGVEQVQACEDVKRTLDILEAKILVIPKDNTSDGLRKSGGIKADDSLENSAQI